MSSDPQVTQIHLLRHQRTELPPSKAQRKQFKKNKLRPKNMGYSNDEHHQAHYKQNEFNKKKFNPRQILQSKDRCHKCGDSKHIEGFQCSARKYQCRSCHKFSHFSSLCYKKQESYKKKPRSPKAYQPTCGRLSTPASSISGHSSDTSFSEEEPFCMQMKVQDEKDNASVLVIKHLVTNLEFKVKPYKRKTKFLRARVDKCADVNLMPVSIYKKLFKDEDCTQITPSKLQLATYTNMKVRIIGSCKPYIMYPDTRCLEETKFYVAAHEGSTLISCATSLALSLIKPHKQLDHPPPKGNRSVIYSSVDKMKKKDESQLKVQQTKLQTSKEAPIVCSRDGKLKSNKEQFKNGCSKGEQSQNENKECQVENDMQPVKPKKDMQSEKPAIESSNKKPIRLNKNCKATVNCKKQKKCEYDDSISQSTVKKEF